MKNLITITNLRGGSKSTLVENFSKENIVQAVSKFLEVDAVDVKIAASSMSEAICEITKKYRGLKKDLTVINGLENSKDEQLVHLILGKLI